jgi:hypothetical protein
VCNALLNTILTVAVSAIAGVCAWVGANFFAEPLLQFYKRRRAVRESMLYSANVDASRKELYDATYEELRRHAAALDALDETAPKVVKMWLRRRGFDLTAATSGILGFSNSLGSYDGSRGVFRDRIRKALRFKGEF